MIQLLTKESLDAAVIKCRENDYYSVLIITRYAIDHSYILDYLSRLKDANVIRCFGHPWVKFQNKSIINMTSIGDTTLKRCATPLILCSPAVYKNRRIKQILRTSTLYQRSTLKSSNEGE